MTEGSAAPLGALLEDARTRTGISGREAARRAVISEGRWRQIVGGASAPARTIVAMAVAVGADPHDALLAAGLPATDEGVAELVKAAHRRSVTPRRAPGLVAEIERIKAMPLEPEDKIRIAQALIEMYQEKADRDAELPDQRIVA